MKRKKKILSSLPGDVHYIFSNRSSFIASQVSEFSRPYTSHTNVDGLFSTASLYCLLNVCNDMYRYNTRLFVYWYSHARRLLVCLQASSKHHLQLKPRRRVYIQKSQPPTFLVKPQGRYLSPLSSIIFFSFPPKGYIDKRSVHLLNISALCMKVFLYAEFTGYNTY